jgi:uncharacterized protein DUF2188
MTKAWQGPRLPILLRYVSTLGTNSLPLRNMKGRVPGKSFVNKEQICLLLALAEQHLAEAETIIRQQGQLIVEIQAQGLETNLRDAWLDQLRATASALGIHRESIVKAIESVKVKQKQAIHIVPHKQGWAVRREGATRSTSIHRTQEGAQKAAQRTAQKDGVEIVVQTLDSLKLDKSWT